MKSSLMSWLKRVTGVLLLLVILGLVIDFTLSNDQVIRINVAEVMSVSVRFSSAIITAFITGGGIGLLSAIGIIIRLRLKNASLGRKLVRRNNEIRKLRSSNLKGLTNNA
ncbi:Lipopolysaccharide assembly protein A [invertebrate metagenome]|uniref:Lipopolysaccharide assembly protein A n=1 Tax=invertebrate metagenome TaxID=1711999 RepID=A0A2H9T8M6_9ZZZZ